MPRRPTASNCRSGDRRGAARFLARRLGRFRPRRAGLSEACRQRDRLGGRGGNGARPPPDGASGQGRLLGHRGEARAGARSCRLSGVHAQGDDRPQLLRLRAQAAWRRGRGFIRSSPRTTRSRWPASSRMPAARGLRIPAPARHGRGALPRAARRIAGCHLPRLRAGRRLLPICSLTWCGGFWRTAPIPPSSRSLPIRRCRLPISSSGRRAGSAIPSRARHPHIPLPRDLFAPRENSSGVEFGDSAALAALLDDIRAAPQSASATPLIDGVAVAGRARNVISPIDGQPSARVQEGDEAIVASAISAAAGRLCALGRNADCRACRDPRARRRPHRAEPRPADRAAAKRGRQDARRLRLRSARGRRLLPLLRGAGAAHAGAAADAGADRGEQRAPLPRPRRLRLHQPVEFPARHLHRADRRCARCRQCRGGQARRADAADRLRGGEAAAPAGVPARALHLVPGDGKVGAMLTADRRVAGVVFTGSTEVAQLINRALAGQGRSDRAADRRNRRHQRHDRRCHRLARAGDRRRHRLCFPLRRPALLGAAAAVRAGRRGGPSARHDGGRRARTESSAIRASRRPRSGR